MRALAIHHYRALLVTSPEAAMARNNLGVQFAQLAMPLKAFECYEQSSEGGETLATGNLAWLFVGMGDQERARSLIDSARHQPSPNPTVFEADAALQRNLRNENERERELMKFVGPAREALRTLALDISPPDGDWIISGVGSVALTVKDGVAEGEVGTASGMVRVKLERAQGGLKLTLRAGQYGTSVRHGWGGRLRADEFLFVIADEVAVPEVVRMTGVKD